jgi:adenine-specific DNA-methyltransferase
VPSEFKELAIPYRDILPEDIAILKALFKKKASVNEIINYVNSRTINLDFAEETVNQYESIRVKLIKRRKVI